MFSYEFCEISKNNFLQNKSGRALLNIRRDEFGLKNKIYAGINFQVFAINRTDNYYRETAPYIIIFSRIMKPKLGNKYCK